MSRRHSLTLSVVAPATAAYFSGAVTGEVASPALIVTLAVNCACSRGRGLDSICASTAVAHPVLHAMHPVDLKATGSTLHDCTSDRLGAQLRWFGCAVFLTPNITWCAQHLHRWEVIAFPTILYILMYNSTRMWPRGAQLQCGQYICCDCTFI